MPRRASTSGTALIAFCVAVIMSANGIGAAGAAIAAWDIMPVVITASAIAIRILLPLKPTGRRDAVPQSWRGRRDEG